MAVGAGTGSSAATSGDRSSPIGVFLHAQSYLRAADALAREVSEGRLRLRFDAPVRHLYWQALENVLKSFLMTRRVSSQTLRGRTHGHDLSVLYDACLKRRLALGRSGRAARKRIVALMSADHTGPDFADRYLRIGFARRPTLEACSVTCHHVFNAVEPHVHRHRQKR